MKPSGDDVLTCGGCGVSEVWWDTDGWEHVLNSVFCPNCPEPESNEQNKDETGQTLSEGK